VLGKLARLDALITVVTVVAAALTALTILTVILNTVHGKNSRVPTLILDPLGKVLETLVRIHVLQSSAQDLAYKDSSFMDNIDRR
jgi:hypothetical protein